MDHYWRNTKATCRAMLVPLCLCAIVAGCSPTSQGPETNPVTGRVTYKGEPVGGVTLTFTAESDGVDAQALTDDEGKFDVFTYFENGKQEKRGMVAGQYRVSAVKLDRESIKTTMQPPKNLLPQVYASPDTSPLETVVSAGQENTPVFDLK